MATASFHRFHRALRPAIVFALVLSVAACTTTQKKQAAPVPTDGIYLVENGNIEAAVRQDFATALELLQAGDYPRAITLLERVTQSSQNNSAPYINLAMAYAITENYERAEHNLEQALRINPAHPVSMHELALLYRKTGRYDESRDAYEALVKKYPEFMPARRNFGILCELYLNDAPCALAQYQSYITENPEDEEVKLWILGLERKLGN